MHLSLHLHLAHEIHARRAGLFAADASLPMMMARWLLVLLTLGSAAAKRRTNRGSTNMKSEKIECERTCLVEEPDEDLRPNCVLRCQSAECYNEIYMPEELEPGEIDTGRQRLFSACLTAETKKKMQEKRSQARRGVGGGPANVAVPAAAAASENEEEDSPAQPADAVEL